MSGKEELIRKIEEGIANFKSLSDAMCDFRKEQRETNKEIIGDIKEFKDSVNRLERRSAVQETVINEYKEVKLDLKDYIKSNDSEITTLREKINGMWVRIAALASVTSILIILISRLI